MLRICVQKRHNSTNANAQTLGATLRTNTDGQWDMIQGSYICDVVAGDIISFTYNASGIASMDGGQWANYNFTLHPSKITSQGNAGASTLPWIHQQENKMAGMITTEVEGRIIKWSKSGDIWTIQLVRDEENSESDGRTNLRIETVLETMTHDDS